MKRVRLCGMCGLLLAAAAAAQEPKADTRSPAAGAKPGDFVPAPLRAFVVADGRFKPKVAEPKTDDDLDPRDRTNKMHDPVGENGLSPVVAVFVRADAKSLNPGSGVEKLLKELNRIIPGYRADRLAAFVLFLQVEGMPKTVTVKDAAGKESAVELDAEYPDDEKRDERAAAVRDFAGKVQAPNVLFGLAPVKSKATDAWGVGANDDVTVVIYNRMRVVNRWTFKANDGPTDDQVKQIVAATEEMITGKKAGRPKD